MTTHGAPRLFVFLVALTLATGCTADDDPLAYAPVLWARESGSKGEQPPWPRIPEDAEARESMIEIETRFILTDRATTKVLSDWLAEQVEGASPEETANLAEPIRAIDRWPGSSAMLRHDQALDMMSRAECLAGTHTVLRGKITLWDKQRSSLSEGTRETRILPSVDGPDQPLRSFDIGRGYTLDVVARMSSDRRYVQLDMRPQAVPPNAANTTLVMNGGRSVPIRLPKVSMVNMMASTGIRNGHVLVTRNPLKKTRIVGYRTSLDLFSDGQQYVIECETIDADKPAERFLWALVRPKIVAANGNDRATP